MSVYRDDLEALRGRARELAAELQAVRGRRAQIEALGTEEAEIARELTAVEERIAVGSAPRRGLPMLDAVRVASPCNAKWEDMLGDERVRHCLACDKQVFNLSAMTTADAEALLAGRAGEKTCVRLYRRADGTVMTSDCPVGATRKRRKVAVLSAFGAGALAAGAFGFYRSTAVLGAPPVAVAGEMAPVHVEVVPAPPVTEMPAVMGDSIAEPRVRSASSQER